MQEKKALILPPLEVRPSSIAPNPAESREAPPTPQVEGVPGLPGAPQDEAGLMGKFDTYTVELAGPLGTPLGLAQWKRASSRGEAGTSAPAMKETPVRFLGQEDPLEEEVATHSSILAWGIPWT